jgi:formylglycine-generating enzyme required for sulfatase activity
MAFCHWLSRVRGEHIRLPSELEWQLAAQGVSDRAYPWGDSSEKIEERANIRGSGIGAPTAVGIYPRGATSDGVMDLAGNVWEWCCDAFEDPPNLEWNDCDDPQPAEFRVVRGGSWWAGAQDVLCTAHEGFRPSVPDQSVGLRLVRVGQGNEQVKNG